MISSHPRSIKTFLFVAFLFPGATRSSAIELRIGAQCGYRVERFWENTTTFATFTVMDSTSDQQGERWKVQVRDSVLGTTEVREAMAEIQVVDGRMAWSIPRCLYAWDLMPWSGDSISTAGFGDSSLFGQVSLFCGDNHGLLDTNLLTIYDPERLALALEHASLRSFIPTLRMTNFFGADYAVSGEIRRFNNFKHLVNHDAEIPQGRWDSTFGMVRWTDRVSSESWVLETWNGAPIRAGADWDTAWRPAASLSQGSRWTWWGTDASSQSGKVSWEKETDLEVRWTVVASLPDSSGWIRRSVRVEELRDGVRSSNVLLPLRIDLRNGSMSFPGATALHRLIASSMVRRWSDSPLDATGGWGRLESHDAQGNGIRTTRIQRMRSRTGEGPVNLMESEVVTNRLGNWSTTNIRSTNLELLASAPGSGNPQGGSIEADGRMELTTVRQVQGILRQNPDAVALFVDLGGRRRILEGSRTLEDLLMGPGVWTVRLQGKDGIFASGKVVVPAR